MEEPQVRNRRPIRRTKEEHAGAQSRKLIPLLFIGFGLFCVIQALNLYLRISMETKNQQIRQERDALEQQRDTLKQKLQDLDNLTSEGWQYFQGGWYLSSTTKQSWNESRKFCQEKGADLIIINSIQEQEFAHRYGIRWIGMSDLEQEGVWRWVDGSLLNISFWSPGQPDNKDSTEHCGNTYFIDKRNNWNDVTCSWKYYCTCEK